MRENTEYLESRSRIELQGNHRVIIDGCDGIIDYSNETVLFKMGKLEVGIKGKKLKLEVLTENSAVIDGLIQSVSYYSERG